MSDDGARLAKRHKRRRMLFISVQKDEPQPPPERVAQTADSSTLWTKNRTQNFAFCNRWSIKVCILSRWIHPVDADHNRGRLRTIFHRYTEFLPIDIQKRTTLFLYRRVVWNSRYQRRIPHTLQLRRLHARHFMNGLTNCFTPLTC